ncbi:MAG: hypothetical protein MJ250_08250 [Alphaproteobacteria bacterium]|nr:hypothetical protein [Alphaproteobacteria bacterium]
MEIENKKVESKADLDLLEGYLYGAKMITQGMPKKEAEKTIEGWYKSSKDRIKVAEFKEFMAAPDAWDAVTNAEKALKKESKEFGLREKVAYAVDANHNKSDDYFMNAMMATLATSTLMPLTASDPNRLSIGMLSIAAATTLNFATKSALTHFSRANDEQEKSDADRYADLKHAQFALKCLKRDLTKPATETEKLMAAGYGQPSGGLIQNVALMQAGFKCR